MALSVHVVSREIIKPSSPTPKELSSHKLCLLDQLAPPVYGSIVFFFLSAPEYSLDKLHDHLKTSLSIALTRFYPLAGRLQDCDNFSINCNDEGACYIAALASVGLPELENSQIQPTQLVKLLPANLHGRSADLADRFLMGVQATSFACGGIAIGISIWHQVGDASTVSSFLETWTSISHGEGGPDDVLTKSSIVTDCSSVFPPSDQFERHPGIAWLPEDLFTNNFFFDVSSIASLKEMIGDGMTADELPTRYEALAALIWGAAITMIYKDKLQTPSGKFSYTMSSVDMRKKVNPPLPQHCMGNIIFPAVEKWEMDKAVDYPELARKIRNSVRMVDQEYVLNRPPPFANLMADSVGSVVYFSGLLTFPFYEIDLGFGKPSWIVPYPGGKDGAFFVEARDHQGIEALVTLSKEDMVKFEQDPRIIEYAKFRPTPYFFSRGKL